MANFATLADVIAGCATLVTVDRCDRLFIAATPPRGAAPTDTLTAAQSIARNPWYQPQRLYALLNQFYPVPKGENLRPVPFMPSSIGRRARGCFRSSLTVAGIVRAARPCSTVRATFGSAITSQWVGRGGSPMARSCDQVRPEWSPTSPITIGFTGGGMGGAPRCGCRRQ